MNPLIQTQFGFADPNASPLTINELIALLNTLVVSQIIPENSYIPYVIGHDQPGVDDQDKAWIQLDTAGNPIAIKTWVVTGSNSNWRRIYNGMMGEIRGFSGVPGYGERPALFDITGKGNITLEYDGWAICNGNNGTPDLSDRFLVGGHLSDPGSHGYGSNGWQTSQLIEGVATIFDNSTLATNGSSGPVIANKNLPIFDNSLAGEAPGLIINGNEYDSSASHGGNAQVIVSTKYDTSVQHHERLDPTTQSGYGVVSPVALKTLPPFYIMAWIAFIGY